MIERSTAFEPCMAQRRSKSFPGRYSPRPGIILVCGLLFLLSACSLLPTPSQSGTISPVAISTVTPTKVPSSPTPSVTPPAINLTVSGCPALSINWDALVGTTARINKVQTVACSSLEGAGSLTALVNVRYYSPAAKLDAYVYDNLTGTPTKRFEVQGLVNGDAKIGPTNTIMTAEASPSNTTPTLPNLFREYQWNGSEYVQILFPGIFPDMTDYQAQQSQALATANPSSEGWRNSGSGILDRLTHDVFHWPQTQNRVVTYNASGNTYIVEAVNLGPGGGGVMASLFHLDNVATNIFEIKQLTSIDGNLVVSSPASGTQVSSPINISAHYTANSGILGRVVLYDNTYFASSDSGSVSVSKTAGTANFTLTLPFTLDEKGVQEAVVAIYVTYQNSIAYSNEVALVKVFVSA